MNQLLVRLLLAASITASMTGCEVGGNTALSEVPGTPMFPGIPTPTPTPVVSKCDSPAPAGNQILDADVVVYGATPSGVMAATEAASLGKRVILLEASSRVGGKFGNGIGIGEVKDIDTIGGRARQFFVGVRAHYGYSRDVDASRFEPKVAGKVLGEMLCGQSGIQVFTGAPVVSVAKSGTRIDSLLIENGSRFTAKVFIDSSYEGDLLAAAGVSFIVGREAKAQYNEELAGIRVYGNANNSLIDPYNVPGDPASGVIPLIDATTPGAVGAGDHRIQAYTYRICVTAETNNRVPFTPPPGYDEAEYEAVARMVAYKVSNGDSTALDRIITLQGLPNRKFDVNNVKDISVDFVGPSSAYPEASREQRQLIAARHERFVKGFMYYLATSPRLPAALRNQAAALGYCKDEYVDNGNFPSQLYVRQARRMIGTTVVTQNDIRTRTAAQPIGLGHYWLDVHTVSMFANRGIIQAEGHLFTEVPDYQIPYAALTPKAVEATNLLVSVCMSASHVAYSSIRVEPTYMIMGHAAGAASALAIDEGVSVQDVDYSQLSRRLLEGGQILNLVR